MTVRVYLAARNPAALTAALQAVTTPGSPQFRHFITPQQYAATYAPTAAQVAAVSGWLASSGMHVSRVADGNRYVVAKGSVAAAQRAFGTTLRTYKHRNKLVTAPAADATVPAEVAGYVAGVTGLDNLPHLVQPTANGNPPPGDASLRARPCSQWYGQLTATTTNAGTPIPPFMGSARPWATCGYLPQQMNAAYGANTTGLDGSGTTVGIGLWYASTTQPADNNRFDTDHGWPAFAPGQYTTVQTSKFRRSNICGPAQNEQAIDITAIHDIAPAAKVVYYAAGSCFDNDLLDMFARVVDDDTVSVMNNSWGGPLSQNTSGLIAAYEQVFNQAALQGQAIFFSSGDSGDWVAAEGQTDYDFPASDPLVTAVGGTTLNLGPANNYVWEAGWGYDIYALSGSNWVPEGFGAGAGGGFAPAWSRPSYQDGVVMSNQGGRAYPDIAADADNATGLRTGYVQHFPTGNEYAETRWGGTSVASPLMVGEQALAEQANKGRIGFANPLIYKLARTNTPAFTDITNAHDSEALVRVDFNNLFDASAGYNYTVRTIDDDSSLTTGPGWDDVTGVGTPNASYPKAMAKVAH
jgi:subtilase family serine protease